MNLWVCLRLRCKRELLLRAESLWLPGGVLEAEPDQLRFMTWGGRVAFASKNCCSGGLLNLWVCLCMRLQARAAALSREPVAAGRGLGSGAGSIKAHNMGWAGGFLEHCPFPEKSLPTAIQCRLQPALCAFCFSGTAFFPLMRFFHSIAPCTWHMQAWSG